MSDYKPPENFQARRVNRELTPDEAERLQTAREQSQAEMPELRQRADKLEAALREETVSGQLRQAVVASRLQYVDLARHAEISTRDLADFMVGEAELNSATFDRLADLLGCRLVTESA